MARSPKSERKSSYEQIWSGVWTDIEEMPLDIACCDCGLVHEVDARIHDGKVQIRLTEKRRETGQLRRYHDHPCKPQRRK